MLSNRVATVILTLDGKVLQEMPLSKDRITIGRRSHNDIVIDDLAISAEHAVIVSILEDSFLEDLNSTNGTQINGQPIKKHFLQHDDVIELARYKLRYIAEDCDEESEADAKKDVGQCPVEVCGVSGQHNNRDERASESSQKFFVRQKAAAIKILSGGSVGREIGLTKALTTIGHPGAQVVVISNRSGEYSIAHVEGNIYPEINGQSIGAHEYVMQHGDLINLSGTKMVFSVD